MVGVLGSIRHACLRSPATQMPVATVIVRRVTKLSSARSTRLSSWRDKNVVGGVVSSVRSWVVIVAVVCGPTSVVVASGYARRRILPVVCIAPSTWRCGAERATVLKHVHLSCAKAVTTASRARRVVYAKSRARLPCVFSHALVPIVSVNSSLFTCVANARLLGLPLPEQCVRVAGVRPDGCV